MAASISMNSTQLNSAQLKEHYALCIQLGSSNKINSKNAFGLHVIDYMDQLTKNQKDGNLNFKLVSSTLDVGTKIYSNRVDSVSTQAQKVASNLHHALDDKKGAVDEDADEENREENEDQATKKKTKQRAAKKNKTLGTKESVTLNQLEFTGEQDQLFLKLSSTVDVGATNSYLIETLDIDSSYTFRIDSTEPYYRVLEQKNAKTEQEQSNDTGYQTMQIDISDFHEKFMELSKKENLKICPRLDTFNFNNLNDGFDYGQNSAYAFRNLSTMNDNNSLFHDELDINENLDPLGDGFDDLDALNGSGDDGFGGAEGMTNEYSLAHKSIINSDNVQFMLGIINALSDNPSDYCLFNKKITLTWAGHEYWKANPVYRMKMNQLAIQKATDGQAAGEKVKRAPKVFAEIDMENYQDEPINAKVSDLKLKSATLENWMNNKTLMLPEDFKRQPSDFVTRFTKDPYNVLVRHRHANLDNTNMDNSLFGDNDPDDLADGLDNNNDDHNSDTDAGNDFDLDAFDYATQETDQQNTGPLPFTGDNLVDQPQIIPTVNLPYTKFAKKIDVKRLKSAIWDLIQTNENEVTQFNEIKKSLSTTQCDQTENETTIDESNSNERYVLFSTIYQQLPTKVHTALAKNLSAPITLVTLLHVVNEKNLKIEATEDLSDFSVITNEELFK